MIGGGNDGGKGRGKDGGVVSGGDGLKPGTDGSGKNGDGPDWGG